jgi:ATP-dependent protease ClpP protease subunit
MEFKYTVDPLAPIPIMLLTDDIGFDAESGKGIDGAEFQRELLALDNMGKRSIDIWINSPGGNVTDGYNIYGTMLKCKTPVDTHNLGMAASIAGIIFLAGRNRIMADYSWLMLHDPHGGNDKKLLNVMKDSIATMASRCGKTVDEMLSIMKKTTYIYAVEAKQDGLCDIVEPSDQKNKKRLSLFAAEPTAFHKEANLILNKIIEKPTHKTMIKVANKLGLNPDASEDSILSAIEQVQNKAKTDLEAAEDKIKDAQNALKEAEDEMDKLKKEKASLKDEKDKVEKEKNQLATDNEALQKEKDDAEEASLKVKCKAMVEGYANTGRIKKDAKVIDFYTELAMADKGKGFDIVKDQLEALPLNKIAPVITLEADAKPKYTFAAAMGTIANKVETQKNNK